MGKAVSVILSNFQPIDPSRVLLGPHRCRLCGRDGAIIKVQGSAGDIITCSACMAEMVGDYCKSMGLTIKVKTDE